MYLFKFLKENHMQQCVNKWRLKADFISCWNEKQNLESYLPANKHTCFEFKNCLVKTAALLDVASGRDKRIFEY